MVGKLVLLGLAALLVCAQASCPTCGNLGGGTDVCGCQVNVVRPVRPQRIQPSPPRVICTKVPGVEKFRPIGDVCSCGNSIVSPAYVPKQRCNSCQQRYQQQIQSYSSPLPYALDYSLPIPAPPSLNNFEPEETGSEYDYLNGGSYSATYGGSSSSSNIANDDAFNNFYSPQQPLAPADAVSLTLAYGLQQQAARSVPEERLQFGFRQIPKDSPIQKQTVDIPEERLFTVDRQIVELKPNVRAYGCGAGSQLEEEAAEDLLQIQQDELEANDQSLSANQAYLSYRDIGYVPESLSQNRNQYIVNQAVQSAQYDDLPSSPVVLRNDGFVPGAVINRNQQLEYLEDADVSAAYGSDEDVEDIGYSVYSSGSNGYSGSYGGSYGPNSYSANAGTSGILVQKLSGGCSGN